MHGLLAVLLRTGKFVVRQPCMLFVKSQSISWFFLGQDCGCAYCMVCGAFDTLCLGSICVDLHFKSFESGATV